MDVSVVIPTRNRHQSLLRLLNCLNRQIHALKKIIVVDSSDESLDVQKLKQEFPKLKFNYIVSEPSVCIQRNIGIQTADSTHIFLCDDDVEPPPDYVSTLMDYLQRNPGVGAVSGLFVEASEQGQPKFEFPATSFRQLLWNFVFQLTVWADIDKIEPHPLASIPFHMIKKFYLWRQNTLTLAGWPLITRFADPSFNTSIYTLGASIVRRGWLLQSPYDEILDYHGIGDNYGVEVNFPREQAITILTGVRVFHHKESRNRLADRLTFYRRILALHYFVKKNDCFSTFNRALLVWSLIGAYISHRFIQKDKFFAYAVGKALKKIITGKNPYVLAHKRGENKPINPILE